MWYVIQTVPGQEQECAELCRVKVNQALYKEMFVPSYIRKMHFKKQWHDVKKVLFPGYFFVDTEKIDAVLKELASLPRLTKALRNAELVSPITAEEQKFLSSMLDQEHVMNCSTGLIIGSRICITEGPLRNHYGFIRKIDRHRRTARLEINFFGHPTPVEAGLEILARLTEEEFEKLKADSLETYAEISECRETEEIWKEKSVRIKSGIFAGMHGILVSKNETKDEWRVRILLFENPMEVVFSGKEIAVENARF